MIKRCVLKELTQKIIRDIALLADSRESERCHWVLEDRNIRKHTLYAYAEGNDLHEVADTLDAAFTKLIAESGWVCGQPSQVNQRRDEDPSLGPDDQPDWEIGLNLSLPNPGMEPLGWFADVERIVEALERMHMETGRDFVLGIGHEGHGISEDVAFIGEQSVDRAWLRRAFGAGEKD
jgi:hypothetical protein